VYACKGGKMGKTYLTAEELSERIKFSPRYIREKLKERVFIRGVHYIQPFGRRILFVWEEVEKLLYEEDKASDEVFIPLRRVR
jgi:hypothetical protein